MNSEVVNLIRALHEPEMRGFQLTMRSSLHNSSAQHVEKVRAEFLAFLRERPLSGDQFFKGTNIWVKDDDELYQAAADAYRFYFEEGPVPEYLDED